MPRERNPEFLEVEKYINSGKGTIEDYRILHPDKPQFKIKTGSITDKNARVSFKNPATYKREADVRAEKKTHESDLSKAAANKYSRNQKQEFDLGRSFGYESYDEHLIALDHYEKFGSRLHGSHDPQNRLSRFVDDTLSLIHI